MTKTFKVMTDSNGNFTVNSTFNPPGPFGFTVNLKATLISPDATTVTGKLDSDAADGDPSNEAKDFSISTGETVDLGKWKLDGGDNIISVTGRTEPVRANTEVEIEVSADF